MEGLPGENISNNEGLERAEKLARKLIGLMTAKIGINIPEENWPEIKISPEGYNTSAYDKKDNVIYLNESRLGSGITYGEEIGHFIRCYFERENGEADIFWGNPKVAVDEFYGRLGENIAREVSMGTELEVLFGEEDERKHFKDEKLEEEIKNDINKTKPLLDKLEEVARANREGKIKIADNIKSFFAKLKDAELLCQEAKQQKMSPAELGKEVLSLVTEGSGGREELAVLAKSLIKDGGYPDWAQGLFDVLTAAEKNLAAFKSKIEEMGSSKDDSLYTFLESDIWFIKSSCKMAMMKLSNLDQRLGGIEMINNAQVSLHHTIGYAAAEKYMQKDPDWLSKIPVIFKYKNREALEEFIENDDFQDWLQSNESMTVLKEMIEQLKRISDLSIFPSEEYDLD